MAVFSSPLNPGVDWGDLRTDTLFNGARVVANSTNLQLGIGMGSICYFGTGLRYSFSGGELTDIRAGRINSLTVLLDGGIAAQFSGLNLDAEKFYNLVDAGKQAAVLKMLFAGNDIIVGGTDTDIQYGRAGNDTLYGGGGLDVLVGGIGNDRLVGGDASDRFVFNTALNRNTNVDRITDFNAADDAIILDNDIFRGLAIEAVIDSTRLAFGTAAGDANDRIIIDQPSGRMWYDRDGTGGADQILFARFAQDFLISNLNIAVID